MNRHDRNGHGTWVQLAAFVVHDCRPWLSVTGTRTAGPRSRREWIRELVTGERRFARYGFWGCRCQSQFPHHTLTEPVNRPLAGERDQRNLARLPRLEAHCSTGGDI